MKRTQWMVVALVAAGLMVGGCGKGGSGSGGGAATAKTPKDAIMNFAKGLKNGDKALAMSAVQATGEQKEVVEASVDMFVAMQKFTEDMKKAYGAEAVKQGPGNDSPFDDLDALEKKMKITEKGDTAEAIMEGKKNDAMKLVKVDGAWKIDLATMMMKDEKMKPKQMIAMAKGMAKAFDEVRPNIGKAGSTAESINKEVMAKMFAAMAPMMKEAGDAGGEK